MNFSRKTYSILSNSYYYLASCFTLRIALFHYCYLTTTPFYDIISSFSVRENSQNFGFLKFLKITTEINRGDIAVIEAGK